MNEYWCIPPKENANFIVYMEYILDIYEIPYHPIFPVICMDEKPYPMLGESIEVLPVRLGDIPKTDSEYIRKKTFSIFIDPLSG